MLGRSRAIAASSTLKPKDGARLCTHLPPAPVTTLGDAPCLLLGMLKEGLKTEKGGQSGQHLMPGAATCSLPLTRISVSPCSQLTSVLWDDFLTLLPFSIPPPAYTCSEPLYDSR